MATRATVTTSSSSPSIPSTCIFTLLLSFTGLILPRSSSFFAELPPQSSSLDKPQHPFLHPITARASWTLAWLCVGTVVCVSWWAGWVRVWVRGANADFTKVESLRNAWTNTIASSFLFHVLLVLFGAPITTHIPETYLLSSLLSLLAIFTPSYAHSFPIFPSLLPATPLKLTTPVDRALAYPTLGTLVGAWLGAFPIPLDWDRPWQTWPLTPAYGALAGHIVGEWAAIIVNVALDLARVTEEMDAPEKNVQRVIGKRKRKKGKEGKAE